MSEHALAVGQIWRRDNEVRKVVGIYPNGIHWHGQDGSCAFGGFEPVADFSAWVEESQAELEHGP